MFRANPKYASPWPCLLVLAAYTAGGLLNAFSAPTQKTSAVPSVGAILFAIFLPAIILTVASWFSFLPAARMEKRLGEEGFLPEKQTEPKPACGFWKAFGIGAGMMAVYMPVILLLTWGSNLLLSSFGMEAQPQEAVAWLMSPDVPMSVKMILIGGVIFIAPFNEELFFRFTLFRVLESRLKGRFTATLAVAALFAGIHFNLAAFVPLFCLAILFSELIRRTGRYAAPFAAHTVFNLVSVLLALMAT